MFNLVKRAIGRKAVLMGGVRAEMGHDIPMMVFRVYHHWWSVHTHILDCISFMVISEKLLEHKKGDFSYDHMHDKAKIHMVLPEWAALELKNDVARALPIVTESLRRQDERLRMLLDHDAELKEKVLSAGMDIFAFDKFKRIHAQVNGYKLEQKVEVPETAEKPVLH